MAFSGSVSQLKFQQSITNLLNETVTDFAQSNLAVCNAAAKQRFDALVEKGSKLIIAGDLRVSQEAKIVLACIQKQENSSKLLVELQNKITEKLNQETINEKLVDVDIGGLAFQNLQSDIKNIVETRLKLTNDSICTAETAQDGSLIIRDGSIVSIGNCEQNVLDANLKVCENVNVPNDLRRKACDRIANCGSKGELFISQVLGLSGSCDQLQKIAADITQKVTNIIDKDLTQTSKSSISTEALIAIAVIAALIVISGIIFLIIRNKLKKDAQEAQRGPPPQARGIGNSYGRNPNQFDERILY